MIHNTHKVTADEIKPDFARAEDILRQALGPGWTVKRTGNGVRARSGLLSVTLKHHPELPDGPWRSRLRDSFPRRTIVERHGETIEAALHDVAARARSSRAMIEGKFGLVDNSSKSWIAYRLWSAVRPD